MDYNELRTYLAERGFEFTPRRSKKLLKEIENLFVLIKEQMLLDPDYYERMAKDTTEERLQRRRELAESGTETTPQEFDSLIELLLHTYEMIKKKEEK